MKRIKKRRKRPPKKYSTIFVEYAAPVLELSGDLDEFRKAVEVAKLGWNLGVLDRAGHMPFEETLARFEGEPDGDEARAVFEMLVERRQGEFGKYDWVIGDARVLDQGDQWIVRVQTTELRE